MKDIMGLMSKAKEMQSQMQQMQEDMSQIEAEGSAGAGMVKVTITGKFDLRSVTIDPSMVTDGEGEMIEDLIIAAHADAKGKVERLVQEKTQEITSGLQLPPGMKLPF